MIIKNSKRIGAKRLGLEMVLGETTSVWGVK